MLQALRPRSNSVRDTEIPKVRRAIKVQVGKVSLRMVLNLRAKIPFATDAVNPPISNTSGAISPVDPRVSPDRMPYTGNFSDT
jgi:hypothetical protein